MKLQINGVDLAAVIQSELDQLQSHAAEAADLANRLETLRSVTHTSAKRIQTLLDLATSFEVDGISHPSTQATVSQAINNLPLSPRRDR